MCFLIDSAALYARRQIIGNYEILCKHLEVEKKVDK